MRKKILLVGLILLMLINTSCGDKANKKSKISDIPFEILSEDNYPDEVKRLVNERKKYEFMTSYSDGEDLYIIVGYGKQNTGGYSIRLDELYESADELRVATTFIGPRKDKKVSEEESYPCIVIKTKDNGKAVVFC